MNALKMPHSTTKILTTETSPLEPGMLGDRPFWVILDATPTTLIPKRLEQDDIEAVSLYKGRADERHWDIAPYLARLDPNLQRWIKDMLWHGPWGIVLSADQTLEDLRNHFRKFLMVKDLDGDQMYFRFYDPRVLPVFLGSCKERELEDFFGPIDAFWAKQQQSDQFNVMRRTASG